MTFLLVAEGNYLVVTLADGLQHKLPRWFCSEVGLSPGTWRLEKCKDGVALEPRGDGMFLRVEDRGRALRAICLDKFKEVTGVDVEAAPGFYKPVRVEDA